MMTESVSMSSSKGSGSGLAASSSSLYARRKLKEEAESELLKKQTETEALEYLYLSKPAYLIQDGSDVWVDHRDVDAKLGAIILRLKVQSFTERAERLQYLLSVLKKKWANKPETYKGMMTFLTELYDQPTKNLDLVVNTTKYTTSVEQDPSDDTELGLFGEELRQAQLKKAQFRQEVVDELLNCRLEVNYSSEEELSEWSLPSSSSDDDDDEPVLTAFPLAISTKHKPSSVDVQSPPKPSESEMKERANRFWGVERERANLSLRSNLHHVEPVLLTEQPVISSLMALYTRFGEHWEWKKASAQNQRPTTLFISESDIIRELLWQFVTPSNINSALFTSDWKLRPEITLKTVSHSALESFMASFGSLFEKLHEMKQFIQKCTVTESYPSIYLTYGNALSKVLVYVTHHNLDQVERNLKMVNSTSTVHCPRRSTTFVQFRALVQPLINLITSLAHLHSQAISLTEESPNWLKTVKLIYYLELELTMVTHPTLYGVILYIFSQCLMTSLNQILRPLEMKDWNSTDFLFNRNAAVKITDANFWTELVTIQPMDPDFKEQVSFLNWILPKTLTMLKIQEIVNQIGTEIGLQNPPLPSYKSIVKDFLDELLERPANEVKVGENERESFVSTRQKDLHWHLAYMRLKDNVIFGGFKSTLKNLEELAAPSPNPFQEICSDLEYFAGMECIPMIQAHLVLKTVLEKHFEQYFVKGQNSLIELFRRYEIPKQIELVREIVFGGKEDFALACIRLGYQSRVLEQTDQVEQNEAPNAKFQAILNVAYPEDRNNFDIEFVSESKSSTSNFVLKIHPQFPLSLFLTVKTLARYEYVAREVFRIRKGLWILNRLQMKNCQATEVERKQMFLLRFTMIHFWTSLRSFVLLAIFNSSDGSAGFSLNEKTDINEILKVCEEASGAWPLYRILSLKLMDSIIIKPMLHSTLILGKKWKSGISVLEVTSLGLRVRRAWELILEFGSSSYSPEMNQIAHFFGPVPEGIF